ncbi:MAG: hypothetical protein HJJLKODD_00753 [Phycisphaerae bacterium]|nr:hypothetical protein [Phycisphaerae bacterium]
MGNYAKGVSRKTCRRINEPGDAHMLTFSCYRGQSFLSKRRTADWMIEAIQRARCKHAFDLWAYVIMPNHVHLLIYPSTEPYSISAMLKTMKLSVANRAISYVRRYAPSFLNRMQDAQPNGRQHYRFWQPGGGYDRNLVNTRYVWEAIDYLHTNPVRKQLVEKPTDWPWSSARAFAGLEECPLEIDCESLPLDERNKSVI